MKLVYIKWLPRTTTIEVEGETTVMKCTYLLEHVVVKSGKTLKILCSHAIKVLQGLHLDATTYIDQCYSLDNAIHTYAHQFVVPKSELLWRDIRGPRWVPDPQLLQAKGHPVKSRIRNEMDGVWREWGSRREDSDLREIQPRQ